MGDIFCERGVFSSWTLSHLLQKVSSFLRIHRPGVADYQGSYLLRPRPGVLCQEYASHGMAHEEWRDEVLGLEQGSEVLHVGLEGIDGRLCPAAVPMSPQIHGQHPTIARQGRPNKIKPVGIGATAVNQDEGLGTRP